MIINSPKSNQSCPQNIGGFWRFKLAYSAEIVQQEVSTDSELEAIYFAGTERWLADWQHNENVTGELKIENLATSPTNETLKITLEGRIDEAEFKRWFDRYIKGRRLAIEMTNGNGSVRCLNPFFATYTYTASPAFWDVSRYEINFQRTRLVVNTNVIPVDTLTILTSCEVADELTIVTSCELQLDFVGIVTYQ